MKFCVEERVQSHRVIGEFLLPNPARGGVFQLPLLVDAVTAVAFRSCQSACEQAFMAEILGQFRQGDYVWRKQDGGWIESRIVAVQKGGLSLSSVGVGTHDGRKEIFQVTLEGENEQRSIWPGEEPKHEFHANLSMMRYFNSPEVAANLSLAISHDVAIIVRL